MKKYKFYGQKKIERYTTLFITRSPILADLMAIPLQPVL
jgi:hypothetical protein